MSSTAKGATAAWIGGVETIVKAAAVVGCAAATALAAQVRVYVPGDPVPFTLQSLAVLVTACALGPRLGSASMLLYLAAGVLGMPVFADGRGGVTVLLGATGGYLVGFVLAQPMLNALARRGGRPGGLVRTGLGVLAATAVIFAIGVPWLKVATAMSWDEAIARGLVKYVPSLVVKGLIAVVVGAPLVRWSTRRGW